MSQVGGQTETSRLEFGSSSSPSSSILLQPMNHPRKKAPESTDAAVPFASSLKLLLLHLICALGLPSAFWVAFNSYSLSLIQNSAQTLLVVWAIEASVVILVYSLLRRNPDQCSNVKAIVRGLLGLLAGALVNALGAIVLGAPVGIQHFTKTIHWSLLMSVFTFVPAASVFGSSWTDWHRIFAQTKPIGSTDFMICFPAHGAVIGAWFGAWPMPLDWERPWQEWPICVTYGAIFGYLLGLVVSFGFVVYNNQRKHAKGE
ncbi:phosphatidylinositol-glycan biosynthesis class F protein [Sesamum indicum]|uniref:Phosphatidylinositol-glycan biosynthesis class F protein n=1 Tax=Sesamum indicum TaxID=4182 RepID=A0A6I9SZL1_SESIN|nr:phosphatidylinositol-glycan biosynthesis class F protein [Sesamum indicum]XP_011073296.2 phosphatidylinositol-glycan biosynthesis class F protein [Sesamum indicum]XP_011073301.1 phosphatidylinositol-glycan biosynthesis class F protein [Sesamum indicum]XP_020547864.1 phosphatidylinositol-glycan biosynthesis class F protein [Sesamum indicum]XP_020547865.1 phosphatidylinositol-glycan biosynthesis class F protein [Sesamum indicum]XP_020547866.1 phosphatidylinositol-glycan biosynthesis class F p